MQNEVADRSQVLQNEPIITKRGTTYGGK